MTIFKTVEYRNVQRRKNYRRGKVYDDYSGQHWSQEDVKFIHDSPRLGFCDRDVARMLRRSVQAIQVKRWKTKGMFR